MSVIIQNASSDASQPGGEQDHFSEVLVRQRWNMQDYMKLFLIILLSFAILMTCLVFISYVIQFLPIILVALGYGVYFLIRNLRKEYEYVVTNGSLDIDCIIAERKRKRVLSFNPSDIEEVVPAAEADCLRGKKGGLKILDCSSRLPDAELWCIRGKYKEQPIAALFDGHESTLRNLRRYNPNKFRRAL